MQPTRTFYRLAHSPKDMRECHQLASSQDMDAKTFAFPTVVAERDGAIVGVLATQARKDAIVAGPLVVSTPRPLITMMRLVEAYENILKAAGIQGYVFCIDHDNPLWAKIVARAEVLTPYSETNDASWFYRRII